MIDTKLAGRGFLRLAGWIAVAAATALPAAVDAQGLSGPAEGESISQWTERWMDGPVSLIATKEEKEIFGGLGSTQERLQFIRLFWERRDPRLRGPRNEFLDEFESRLAYVEENFANRRDAGWETVFGEVVLHFGEPARTRRELADIPLGFSDRPPILWSYDERIPGLEPNEDLLFAFRAGRWRLMPPYPIGETAIPEVARQVERNSLLGGIPSDYQVAIDEAIERSLVNPVDYTQAIAAARTAVQLPDAQIPFGWSTRLSAPGPDGKVTIEIDLTWRLDSLVFHLVEGEFRTEMIVDAQLTDDGDPVAVTSETVLVTVPEAEMDSRRSEVVRRTVSLEVEPGDYDLEFFLLDRILGYRTVYRDEIEVRGS